MPQPDDRIIEFLTDLSACLCAEITPEGAEEPPTCLCIPIPGNFPAQAYAGSGEDQAWVRLVDTFPSSVPGQQWQGTYDQAFGTSLVVEMGVARCFKLPRNGVFTETLLTSLWTQQMRDLGAMRRAIACCTGRSWDAGALVVGNYRPIGPEGNMSGAVIGLAIQI